MAAVRWSGAQTAGRLWAAVVLVETVLDRDVADPDVCPEMGISHFGNKPDFRKPTCSGSPLRDRSLRALADSDLHIPRARVGRVIARNRP